MVSQLMLGDQMASVEWAGFQFTGQFGMILQIGEEEVIIKPL